MSSCPVIIYYDSDCGFCLRTARFIVFLLRLKGVTLFPARIDKDIEEVLLKENSWIIFDTRTNKRYLRFEGFLYLVKISPFFILEQIRYIPGVMSIGTFFYNCIGFFRRRICVVDGGMGVIYKNIVVLVLGVLACSTAYGLFAKNTTAFRFGYATGFAPMPKPFRDMGDGIETMTNPQQTFLVKDGAVFSQIDLESVIDIHNPPHRMVVPYFTVVNYGISISKIMRRSVLQYICDTHFKGKEIDYTVRYSPTKSLHDNLICE